MTKLIIVLGVFIILHTIIAKATGIPEISDYLPVDWFGGQVGSDNFHKVVPSSEKSLSWLYTLGMGTVLVVLGFLIIYFNKGGSA